MIGVNKGSASVAKAEIEGTTDVNKKIGNNHGYKLILIILGIGFCLLVAYIYIKHKMRKEEIELAKNEEEDNLDRLNLGIQDEGAESFIIPKDSFIDGQEEEETYIKQAELFVDPDSAKPDNSGKRAKHKIGNLVNKK